MIIHADLCMQTLNIEKPVARLLIRTFVCSFHVQSVNGCQKTSFFYKAAGGGATYWVWVLCKSMSLEARTRYGTQLVSS